MKGTFALCCADRVRSEERSNQNETGSCDDVDCLTCFSEITSNAFALLFYRKFKYDYSRCGAQAP